MLLAKSRILAGIAIVSVVAVSVPQAAYAVGCADGSAPVSGGSIASGGIQPFGLLTDSSQLAKYTLVSTATDLAMQVIDDQQNTVCDTALSGAGNPTCSWMPVSGASYTVQVMRPATPAAIAVATAPPAQVSNTSSGSSSNSSGASNSEDTFSTGVNINTADGGTDGASGAAADGPPAVTETSNIVVDGAAQGIGVDTEDFSVCQVQSN